ncbi:MAG: hypothetical protein AAGB31_05960 [Bdellovibrio sp.]
MANQKKDFSYVMCPGSQPLKEFNEIHKQIYKCWHEVWEKTFEELKIEKKVYSDAFTRQDYVGALFFQNICVGMSFFRWAHRERDDFSRDSYFENWQAQHLDVLCSQGPDIIVCSNYTLHPLARGNQLGLSTKDLLLGMIVETFLNSQAHAMTGAVRKSRKVNEVCSRWGATEIDQDIPSGYGDMVDIMAFFKDQVRNHPRHELKALAEDLWNERLHIPRVSPEAEYLAPSQLKKVS